MATQLNNWLSIDKTSGTGNAEITLTASSYKELVDRTTSLKIQAQSTNAILNVRQEGVIPKKNLNNNIFGLSLRKQVVLLLLSLIGFTVLKVLKQVNILT